MRSDLEKGGDESGGSGKPIKTKFPWGLLSTAVLVSTLSTFHGALLLEPPSGTVVLFIVMSSTEVLKSYRKGSLVI